MLNCYITSVMKASDRSCEEVSSGSSSHTTYPQCTHIPVPALSLLLLWASIISYSKCLTRQLASRQMAFQIRSAPFVYFSDFGGVWMSFADSAAHSDVIAGFCSCRVAGKMYTLVISKQLKFYYKWFHICTQSGKKTRLGLWEVSSTLRANPVKRSEP